MPLDTRAGFPTFHKSFGDGPRSALLIHCSLATADSWAGLAHRLSDRLTMRAFDLPGHGRSGDWDGRDEIQKTCTEIAIDLADGPVDVIGHSFGATIALRMAVMRPDLVRSLVLIEPVLFALGHAQAPEKTAEFNALEGDFVAAMKAGDMRLAAREFAANWDSGRPWDTVPEVQRAKLASQMPLIAAAAPALYDDVAGMLKPGVLQGMHAPTLLVEGGRSPAIISHIQSALEQRLPRAQRAVITGAGHMVPITHASQVAAEITAFLAANPWRCR